MKQDVLRTSGTIVAVNHDTFRVGLDNLDCEALCYVAGRMWLHHISLVAGDRVRIELAPGDPSRGRIIYRLP